ncbi:MAG: squalene--hopene cyclase [Gemmataceae bacterium]|nr:squalene--hopene cyclase [Gemmataceae bacterium]MDW8267122.1 prenyltransferase/squalene oxidase repeat-containing protein [Gemmataceae bacterium]
MTLRHRVEAAYRTARDALLAERTRDGHWIGELSTSALSTATAVSALAVARRPSSLPGPHDRLIAQGVRWLAEHQNPDGGWGDTIRSLSNISTTLLCQAAFHLTETADQYAAVLDRAEAHLAERYGATPAQRAEAVRRRYGADRTFAVPILTTCALAGLVDWDEVPPLPFELASLPQSWFRHLNLQVVSYALPALIAIGQAVYYHRPPHNPLTWLARRLTLGRTLRLLEQIQPASGGFLEAVPLTSFVTLSLASIGHDRHPVVREGVRFLVESVRPDGSWPIDSNLATWVTTLSIQALAAAGELPKLDRRSGLKSWLVRQQFTSRHPYTGADPGGWGWTDLPGSVPDADDTPGALLALAQLIELIPDEEPQPSPRALLRAHLEEMVGAEATRQLPRLLDCSWEDRQAVQAGLHWLLGLQNADGGWPTFCRGWGRLPFDRSGADLTAHALRALQAWRDQANVDQAYVAFQQSLGRPVPFSGFPFPDVERAMEAAWRYLEEQQRPDGSWVPLWFGNQHAPDDENPTYGTARVLAAYRDLDKMATAPARRGVAWLQRAQNADGGWGGAPGVASSIEETALALDVLIGVPGAEVLVNSGLAWLVEQVEAGRLREPTPIGFYFAKLWYFEKLYPIIFTVAALGRALRQGIPAD